MILALIMLVPMAIGCFTVSGSAQGEGEMLASFHWISDVHVTQVEDTDYRNVTYVSALKNMKNFNSGKNIGLVISGDITNNASDLQYEKFYAITDANNTVSDANTAIIMGNHDVRRSPMYNDPAQHNPSTSCWEKIEALYFRYNGKYMPDTNKVYHAKEMGGYTFVMLNTELDLSDYAYMTNAQLTWLDRTLKKAYEKDPNKPIFIVTHQPLYETVYDSNRQYTWLVEDKNQEESCQMIKDILSKYPQTITLSGHIHQSLANIRAVSREFGVCIDTSALKETGSGFEVEIYADKVVFRHADYKNNKYSAEHSDIIIPIGENSVSAIYQEAQTVLSETDLYTEQELAEVKELTGKLKPLLNVSYKDVYSLSNWYASAQQNNINNTAQQLKTAIYNLYNGIVDDGGGDDGGGEDTAETTGESADTAAVEAVTDNDANGVETEQRGGCGSTVSVAAVGIVGLTAGAAALAASKSARRKKRE